MRTTTDKHWSPFLVFSCHAITYKSIIAALNAAVSAMKANQQAIVGAKQFFTYFTESTDIVAQRCSKLRQFPVIEIAKILV